MQDLSSIHAPAPIHEEIVAAVTAAAIPAGGIKAVIDGLVVHVHQGMDYRTCYAAYLGAYEEALADRVDWACLGGHAV